MPTTLVPPSETLKQVEDILAKTKKLSDRYFQSDTTTISLLEEYTKSVDTLLAELGQANNHSLIWIKSPDFKVTIEIFTLLVKTKECTELLKNISDHIKAKVKALVEAIKTPEPVI